MNWSSCSSLPWPLIYDTGLRILTLYNYQEIERSYYKIIVKKYVRKTIPLIIALKKLLVNWTKDVKDKSTCNTVKTEFKEVSRRWKDLSCSHPWRINIEKNASFFLNKMICIFNVICFQNTNDVTLRNRKSSPKIPMETKIHSIDNTIISKRQSNSGSICVKTSKSNA